MPRSRSEVYQRRLVIALLLAATYMLAEFAGGLLTVSQALLAVQAYHFPVMLHEVTEQFFGGSADLIGGEMGEAMRRIVANPGDAQAAGPITIVGDIATSGPAGAVFLASLGDVSVAGVDTSAAHRCDSTDRPYASSSADFPVSSPARR